jgi:anti-anti-sigma factor
MAVIMLIPQDGPSKGRPVTVAGPRVVIGRDAGCHLRVGSPAVSRSHAAVDRRGGRLFVRDLGSTNGTVLNGRTLRGEEAEAREGDEIRVGPFRFTLAVGPGVEEPAGVEDLVAGWLLGPRGRASNDEFDARPTEDLVVPQPPSGEAAVKHEVIEDVVVVTPLVPDVDGPAVDPLRAELFAVFERPMPRRVVVNLAHVGHLSGRAIGVLVAHHLRLERAGGALRVCGANPRVAAVLEQVRLAMLVECHPTVEEAVLTAWPGASGAADCPAF